MQKLAENILFYTLAIAVGVCIIIGWQFYSLYRKITRADSRENNQPIINKG